MQEKIELRFYEVGIILIYVVLQIAQMTQDIPYPERIVMGTFQSIISLYLAYRFLVPGLVGVLIVNLMSLIPLINFYIVKHDILFFALSTFHLATIIGSFAFAKLSSNNRTQQRKFRELVVTDEITGLYNHSFLQKKLDQEIVKANEESPLCLVLLDIDNFKILNDTYGHAFGDRVLHQTAQFLKQEVGDQGCVCRYGGDEFVVILATADKEEIESKVSRWRKNYSKLNLRSIDQTSLRLTLSAGFSIYPNLAKSKDQLFSQADMALYHAKNRGKDSSYLYHNVFAYLEHNLPQSDLEFTASCKAVLVTLSVKDKYTLGHSERVQGYVDLFALGLGLDSELRRTLSFAALLHDIGKIEIPQRILNKVDPLIEVEFDHIKNHPVYGAQILEPLQHIQGLSEIVKYHHERFDGRGYPEGLKGDQIPLGARILCIVDSFDAMLSNRPYRKSKTLVESIVELERCAGSQFDADLVRVFIGIVRFREIEVSNEREAV